VRQQLLAKSLFEVSSDSLEPWHTIHNITGKVIAIDIIQCCHVERCCRRTFFLPAFVNPAMINSIAWSGPAVRRA